MTIEADTLEQVSGIRANIEVDFSNLFHCLHGDPTAVEQYVLNICEQAEQLEGIKSELIHYASDPLWSTRRAVASQGPPPIYR